MKKTYKLVALFTGLALGASAQDILVVEPGLGTLNQAIADNQGGKIYELQAGEFYFLTAPIDYEGYDLVIRGQEPAEPGGRPATLQTGTDPDGNPFNIMITSRPGGNLTLQNIYVVNADLNGQIPGQFAEFTGADKRVTIEDCVIDPVCTSVALRFIGGNEKVYLNDNLWNRHGTIVSPNDGFIIEANAGNGVGLDSLVAENNTFVTIGTGLFMSHFTAHQHGYIKWNHNTFVNQKSQVDWSLFEDHYIFTNNLMYNCQTQPWNQAWQPMPGADLSAPNPALIYADTIPGETLPSTRKQFVYYNAHTRSPDFYEDLGALNELARQNELDTLYYMPLMWTTEDAASQARESLMFNHIGNTNADFPEFKFGEYIADEDPLWVDQAIYARAAEFADWTFLASQIHALGLPAENYPPVSEWPDYRWEPDGDISFNATWPVFNGKYANTTLLTAAIEQNLPLGDLNWWPSAKQAWENNKQAIDDHLDQGNTSKIDIGFEGVEVPGPVSTLEDEIRSVLIYPNPAASVLNVSGPTPDVITVMSLSGQVLLRQTNQSSVEVSGLENGVYLVSVTVEGHRMTQRVVIQ